MIEKTQFADDLERFLVEVGRGLKRFSAHQALQEYPQAARRLDYIVHDLFSLAHDLDTYAMQAPAIAASPRVRLNGSRKESPA